VLTRRICLLLLTLVLFGCAGGSSNEKRYPMQGVVKALDPASKTATIDAGKIGDWMEAMTMEYRVKPDAEFAKLHVGDRIQATVVVKDPSYYVTDVKVTPAPAAQ
jgi:Cu/Ag efflux protein CusF